ncbi:MAG TPA: GtrA family protein [Lachnospiraceae bacterium]|nr:GtrA family protein [Lachnospiraceae bacterium]
MKKLFDQLIKFGLVGAFCFVIDFTITVGMNRIGVNYLIAAFFGFVISVTVNYVLSFKFVFKRKENLDRRAEFMIFLILSVIGLGINELIMYLCVDLVYYQQAWLQEKIIENTAVIAAKIIATAVVMVYNFVTRKLFLEKKEKTKSE